MSKRLYFVTCHYSNSAGASTSYEFPIAVGSLNNTKETMAAVKEVMDEQSKGWDNGEVQLFFNPITFVHGAQGLFQVDLTKTSKRRVPESRLTRLVVGEPKTTRVGNRSYLLERLPPVHDGAGNTSEEVPVTILVNAEL